MLVRVHKDTDGVSKERRKRDKKFCERLAPAPPPLLVYQEITELLQVDRVELKRTGELLEVLYITEARDVQDETVWGGKSVEKIKTRDEAVKQSVQ